MAVGRGELLYVEGVGMWGRGILWMPLYVRVLLCIVGPA